MNERVEKMKATKLAAIMLSGAVLLTLMPSVTSGQFYEACYHFLGDYPSQVGEDWTRECQGLAHDASHWFISLNNAAGMGVDPHPQVWKVPVTQDLATLTGDTSGIPKVFIGDIPALAGYDHCGDPDYYEYQGTGYLLLPVNVGASKALAVFNGSNLSYVGVAGLAPGTGAAWCAVDRASPEAFVYMPYDFSGSNGIAKHKLTWADLPSAVTLTLEDTFYVYDEYGVTLQLPYDQGGEFTPSGELLYMVTGICNPDSGDPDPDEEGIHVFDTRTWQRIRHSTRCAGHFNYCYDPYGADSEEPEGITIWDLDGAGAPGISGQVHVVLLDNDEYDYDDVYIKHYTGYGDIYVNGLYPGPEEDGTPAHPFRTVTAGINEAWNGAVLHVQATCYPETLICTKRMEIIAEGGTVLIGTCSP